VNWEAVATISHLVAAIAVVVSSIYLAVQVRAGSATFKTSLRDSTFISLMELNHALLGDKEFVGRWSE